MKLCIPTLEDTGLEASVHGHFGSAPHFTLVDTESAALEVLSNDNAHHAHGTCHPLAQLTGKDIDALVVGGIGQRALASLNAAGLKVYRAAKVSVADVVAAAKADKLEILDAAHACGGHGHGAHRHGQGCDAGHGQGRGHGRS